MWRDRQRKKSDSVVWFYIGSIGVLCFGGGSLKEKRTKWIFLFYLAFFTPCLFVVRVIKMMKNEYNNKSWISDKNGMKTSEGNNEGRKSKFIGEISGVPVPPRKENLILFYEWFLCLSICLLQIVFTLIHAQTLPFFIKEISKKSELC